MADAIPVNQDETPKEDEKGKKGGKKEAAVSPDVLAELKAQITEEVRAELKPQPETVESQESPYKAAKGVKLENHNAVRKDH